ncbi:MAG: PAS domain-containing protein, partial [Alphaproteobacteria bacterium]|nr:PAS domain-containing protein [Alphaproteobacteria bacterium]
MELRYEGDAASGVETAPVSMAASVLPDDAVAGGVVSWMRALGALSVLFSVFALALTALLIFGFGNAVALRAAAVLAATFALAAGVASVVAKQMHRLLSRRIDLTSQAIEATPGAHLILSPNDALVYANSAFRRFFPDLHGAPLAALARRAGGVDLVRLKHDALRGGQALGVLAVANGAGDTQWFNLIVAPLASSRGYTLWSFQDVTARHTMEQMLRDERMKLADFLDNAPIGFYSVDQVGRFLFVNEALAHWLGRGAQELVDSG